MLLSTAEYRSADSVSWSCYCACLPTVTLFGLLGLWNTVETLIILRASPTPRQNIYLMSAFLLTSGETTQKQTRLF